MRPIFIVAVVGVTFACESGSPDQTRDLLDTSTSADEADSGYDHYSPKDADGEIRIADEGESDPCPNGFAYVDFPCSKELECVDQTRYQPMRTQWCDELGYDPKCCGGGMCSWLPEATCAPDELCIRQQWSDDYCAKKDCGGDLGSECPKGLFCEQPYGSCTGPGSEGVCLPLPADCESGGGCVYVGCMFECGCDEHTYGSESERQCAGVGRMLEGPCCNPSKLDFTIENGTSHDRWVACARVQDWVTAQEVEAELRTIEPSVKCSQGGGDSVCSSSEIACGVALEMVPESSRIADEAWNRACRVGGFPFVHRIVGRGGPFCTGPLAEAPRCTEECVDPCGCMSCTFDETYCDTTDKHLLHFCDQGCWASRVCEDLNCDSSVDPACHDPVCAVLSGSAWCYPSCETLLEWWNYPGMGSITDSCFWNSECQVVKGGCEVGLPGECWRAVHKNRQPEDFENFMRQWRDTGCGGETCTCDGTPPVALCREGICTLVPVSGTP